MVVIVMVLHVPVVSFEVVVRQETFEARRNHIENIVNRVCEHRAEKHIGKVERIVDDVVGIAGEFETDVQPDAPEPKSK